MRVTELNHGRKRATQSLRHSVLGSGPSLPSSQLAYLASLPAPREKKQEQKRKMPSGSEHECHASARKGKASRTEQRLRAWRASSRRCLSVAQAVHVLSCTSYACICVCEGLSYTADVCIWICVARMVHHIMYITRQHKGTSIQLVAPRPCDICMQVHTGTPSSITRPSTETQRYPQRIRGSRPWRAAGRHTTGATR